MILDVLAEHEAHATFFVLGQQIAGNEDTLKRAHAEGHELAIHGWDHKLVVDLGGARLLGQVEATAAWIEGAVPGVVLRWWRPPWNKLGGMGRMIEKHGYGYCDVTLDSLDVSRHEDSVVTTVLRGLREGAIVGLHDGIAPNGEQMQRDRMGTVRATGRILAACRSVTVSELLGVRVGT
jgi:peptidoglycan/xylan/chitin deacetylase (PgdA/CDA1 family)